MRSAAPIVETAPPERMFGAIGRSPWALIGDALAPVHPITARGLNNGIDQAAGLANTLTQHLAHGANLDAALAGWQARYLPQVLTNVQQGPELVHKIGLGS